MTKVTKEMNVWLENSNNISFSVLYCYEMENEKVYQVNGEIRLPYEWNSNGDILGYEVVAQFETNWEFQTILGFNSYLQIGGYELKNIGLALESINLIVRKEIAGSGAYVESSGELEMAEEFLGKVFNIETKTI